MATEAESPEPGIVCLLIFVGGGCCRGHPTGGFAYDLPCLRYFLNLVHSTRQVPRSSQWACLGSGDVLLYAIIVMGTGLMIGADLALPSAINGDLIEWDALENNRRRPGLFFALWGTASKLAYALAVGLMFPVLEFAGFDATISNAPDDVRLLAVLYAAPSLLFKTAAIVMMWQFPIDEAEHRRIRAALDARGI